MKNKIFNRAAPYALGVAGVLIVLWIIPGLPFNYYHGPVKHVIVISLDTTRADHLGCYENPWIQTPILDKIASQSLLFNNYISVVPTTLASHVSLFTGTYPHTHGTARNGFMVNKKNNMLAEILNHHGFTTVGFAGAFALASRFGFAQGFDYYDEGYDILIGDDGTEKNQRRAQEVTDQAIQYLKNHRIPNHLFLFLHYFDPHTPYDPPAPYDKMYLDDPVLERWLTENQDAAGEQKHFRRMAALYSGEISYMDHHIGRLLNFLEKKNILEQSILIITSDHGENFWNHPRIWSHGLNVYHSTINAICMVKIPGGKGNTIDELFSNIDLFPSLLKYLKIRCPDTIEGNAIDLKAPWLSEFPKYRFSEASQPWNEVETDPGWTNIRKARCIFDGRLKYIQIPLNKSYALFDLINDPFEKVNLLSQTQSKIPDYDQLQYHLNNWVNSASPLDSCFNPFQLKDTRDKLKSLGYLQ